jgi:hypothetical protein
VQAAQAEAKGYSGKFEAIEQSKIALQQEFVRPFLSLIMLLSNTMNIILYQP